MSTWRVKVSADGRAWNVVGAYDNKEAAAALMSSVNARMVKFMKFLKVKYHIGEADDVISAETSAHSIITGRPTYNMVLHLLANYNPDGFYENDPKRSSETSYTLGKGTSMYICMRDKKTPESLVSADDLFFVMLHECAHIANYDGWGHETDFWEVFSFILHEAHLSGVYRPVDYAQHPITYCGLYVNYNPLYDKKLMRLW